MSKVVYNNNKITPDTFESEEAREDYLEILGVVAWENIHPFGKGLFAKYGQVFSKAKEALTQK